MKLERKKKKNWEAHIAFWNSKSKPLLFGANQQCLTSSQSFGQIAVFWILDNMWSNSNCSKNYLYIKKKWIKELSEKGLLILKNSHIIITRGVNHQLHHDIKLQYINSLGQQCNNWVECSKMYLKLIPLTKHGLTAENTVKNRLKYGSILTVKEIKQSYSLIGWSHSIPQQESSVEFQYACIFFRLYCRSDSNKLADRCVRSSVCLFTCLFSQSTAFPHSWFVPERGVNILIVLFLVACRYVFESLKKRFIGWTRWHWVVSK